MVVDYDADGMTPCFMLSSMSLTSLSCSSCYCHY